MSQHMSEEWGEEDGLTTLLPENGGDWWDVSLQQDPPVLTVGHLLWRWSLFECPVWFCWLPPFSPFIERYPGINVSVGTRGFNSRRN